MTSNLIVFLGVQGSGKNYQCNLLKQQGYIQIDFADELREMAWQILEWEPRKDYYDRDYDWFKRLNISDVKIIHSTSDLELQSLIDTRKNFDIFKTCFNLTGRKFLQKLGTEAIRSRDFNFWVNCWSKKVQRLLQENKQVCTSDCRYLNEIKEAQSLNAQFQFCNFESSRYNKEDPHSSEKVAQYILSKGFKDLDNITAFIASYLFSATTLV